MALCHKWDVKNDFAYVLQFFSLISDSLGSVHCVDFGLHSLLSRSSRWPRITIHLPSYSIQSIGAINGGVMPGAPSKLAADTSETNGLKFQHLKSKF